MSGEFRQCQIFLNRKCWWKCWWNFENVGGILRMLVDWVLMIKTKV